MILESTSEPGPLVDDLDRWHERIGTVEARTAREARRRRLLMRIWVIFLFVAVTIMAAAGLTEYSLRKGYCNQMGADITRVGKRLWCTNGIQPPSADWGRMLGL